MTRVIKVTLKKAAGGNHVDTAGALAGAAGQPMAEVPSGNPVSVMGSDGKPINLAPDQARLTTKPLASDASNSERRDIIRVTLKRDSHGEK